MAEITSTGITQDTVAAMIAQALAGAGAGQTAAQVNTAIATAIGGLSIPTPATAVPPGVADSGLVGSQTTQYATGNHTHASKARKQRMLGVTTATFKWTFPTPFGAGVVPICNAIVEDPSNSASDSYNAQIVGTPTATDVTFRIIRQTAGLLSLLAGALSLNPTPGTVNLHCSALEP